jgi:hypothetical protein
MVSVLKLLEISYLSQVSSVIEMNDGVNKRPNLSFRKIRIKGD